MNKSKSILRIKHFSDSEDDEDNEEVERDEEDNQSKGSDEKSIDSDDELFELDHEAEEEGAGSSKQQKTAKKRKKGIIYLGTIPQHMNVAICREMMQQFGEVGRIFLQPDKKGMTKKANKKKKNVTFTEGWVEFEKKKVAKFVAQHINNTSISNKKGSKFCDILWSLKYLPGFKWIHLSERLTYERAVQHQKLQMAMSKARKEAGFFQHNLDRSERMKKFENKRKRQQKEVK